MPILTLLIWLIVILALFWAARALMGAFGVQDPIATVVYVVLVLLVLYALLNLFGVVGGPAVRLR